MKFNPHYFLEHLKAMVNCTSDILPGIYGWTYFGANFLDNSWKYHNILCSAFVILWQDDYDDDIIEIIKQVDMSLFTSCICGASW